jgi:RNA polymerase II subunit A-like phosphatase
MYELHIYTMGSRSYAHAVVKLFDPDGKLFHDRILSRDDSESKPVKFVHRLTFFFFLVMENRKMLTRIFPTDDRMVVVIDDRSDIWPNCPNLLQVQAYTFFVGTGDIHNPAGMKANQLSPDSLDSQAGVQQQITATVINTDDCELPNVQNVK